MSFSDFGGPKRTQPAASAAAAAASSSSSSSATAAAHRTNGNGSIPWNDATVATSTGPLSVISDSLLQYQRNVGILERIVQSLQSSATVSHNRSGNVNQTTTETIQQYEAQKHVLSHLEEKARQLFDRQQSSSSSASSTLSTSLVKLQRDFQRVQSRATQLHETAIKAMAAIQANNNNNSANRANQTTGQNRNDSWQFNSSGNSGTDVVTEHHQLQQMQLQEDRLHEEIMREREEEIRNINKGMHTVNEIYKDLAHIVGQQQEHVDQIETQMEDSRANAESGLKQVEKANEKYGNSQCTIM